jgi:tetratricopeptide (TPR) repeat protein
VDSRDSGPQALGEAVEEPPREAEEGDLAARARKLYRVAKNLQMQERTGDAIQALEQSVRLDPDSPDAYLAWLMLGRLRLTNPAWSTRAVEALQNASRLHPKAAEPWALMGEIYHRKGFRTNAKGCFKKALELDPSVPIPQDFVLDDKEPEGEEKPGAGMFGKLKGLMKR